MAKARTVTFIYAGSTIDGLLMPNGDYRIALSQVSSLLLKSRKLSVKQLESLSGMSFKSHEKVKTDLGRNKSVTISLDEFSDVCLQLALSGNEYAQVIAKVSVQFTLIQAFEVALGIERTNTEGQRIYEALLASKKARRGLTDMLQKVYRITGCFPAYGKHTLLIYRALLLEAKYEKYVSQYGGRNNSFTFRHHFLSEKDRYTIEKAETNIVFMVTNLEMTLEEAITKL